jgi:hypothetical protein
VFDPFRVLSFCLSIIFSLPQSALILLLRNKRAQFLFQSIFVYFTYSILLGAIFGPKTNNRVEYLLFPIYAKSKSELKQKAPEINELILTLHFKL